MSTRSKGEGTVKRRADGRYEARRWVTTRTGERKRVSGYGKDAKAAIADRDDKCRKLTAGAPIQSSTATVAEVAASWRADSLPGLGTQSTLDTYAARSRVHIEQSALGKVRLRDLAIGHVERWLNTSEAAESSKRQDLIILRHVLEMAVRDDLIADNPARRVKLPKVTRADAEHLPVDAVAMIVERVEQRSRYGTAVRLLALTGMRRGEALALRWRDLTLTPGELAVRGTIVGSGKKLHRQPFPKGKKSRRIGLPADMVARLKAHKATQNAEKLASTMWLDAEGLVFTTSVGTPVDGRNLLRMVQSAARAVGVDQNVGVHTLRHSAATHLIYGAGVPVDVVQRLLGHADVATTLEVYGHPSALDVNAAVSNMSSALSGGVTPDVTPRLTPELSTDDRTPLTGNDQ